MSNHFFAMLNRMKYITRWGLMRNTEKENLKEHSYQVAVLAHALAVIDKTDFGVEVNPERAAVIALFHDASEIITGDMPTPVKYYSEDIKTAYKQIESHANGVMLEKLPKRLQREYEPLFYAENSVEWKYVKAADTLSSYIKCMEELKAGNQEFLSASMSIRKKLDENELKSLRLFLTEFVDSYSMTIDDQVSL